MKYWQEYIRVAYDLVIESEGQTGTFLEDEVEVYLVHLFAKNFNRTDIGEQPIAIQILSSQQYQPIADECLLINSFPLKKQRWPSDTYYIDMGTIAYGLADLPKMEQNFENASRVLHTIFKRIG